jgi:hypothetical protein
MKEERHLHTDSGTSATGAPIPPSASTTKTGAKVSGWMVRLIVEGKVLAVRASSPTLEDLAKNDAALASYPRKEKK